MARSGTRKISVEVEVPEDFLSAYVENPEAALKLYREHLEREIARDPMNFGAHKAFRGNHGEQLRRLIAWYKGWDEFDESTGKFHFDESKTPDYTDPPMGDTSPDLNALADKIGLTFAEAVARLLTPAPETSSSRSATAQPRPKLNALAVSLGLTYVEAASRLLTRPPETSSQNATAQPRLQWQRDRLPDEDAAHFASRAGYVHRGEISSEDRALHKKLFNWLRTHDWPSDVPYIPTLPEWNERQAVNLSELRAKLHDEAERRRVAVRDFVRDEGREVKRLQAVVRRSGERIPVP
jgi:hypothetical protein